MSRPSSRRTLLLTAAALPLTLFRPVLASEARRKEAEAALAALEQASGGRLGVYALDTADGARVGHRAEEQFPFCSTFKVMLSAAILARNSRDAGLLERRVRYTKEELVQHSPVTGEHVADGMTIAALCEAAIQLSDNTAANLLIKTLGGPGAVTEFARSIGDHQFRLDRLETELNTAIPGDPRDTTTPAAMARSLQSLVVGKALPEAGRAQLQAWLRGSKTGANRIRAGVPDGWQVGDKTGSGSYGTTNDAAVLWPPQRAPVVLAVYYTQSEADAKLRDDVIASAARVVVKALS